MALNGTPNDLVTIPIVTVTKMNGNLTVIGTVTIREDMAVSHEYWTMDTMVTPDGLCFLAIPNESLNTEINKEA